MEHTNNRSAVSPGKRSGQDRRVRQTSPFSLDSLRGSRKIIRRAADQSVHYYVDIYSHDEGLLFIFILLLSVADAFLTIELISDGMSELNVVMDYFLRLGSLPFVLVKYLLTATGLVCLLLHKNYPIFRGWLSIRTVMVIVAVMYCALVAYELMLLPLARYFSTLAVSMTTGLTGTS
jgi:hypothetical protein